jgi:predicted Zn-dependent protease
VANGTWSGWSGKSETRFDWLDTARLGKRAIDKAAHNAIPLDLDPGKYTVILEPAAVADLVWWVLRMMDARSAEEGRSFLSRKGGGTRLGEALFDEKVTVYSDPNDPIAPEPVFGEDGLPQRRTVWIDGGIVRNLVRSRFWAKKTGREPVARPRSFVMAGGSASIDQMIRDTRRGILVTRVWYTNLVDPRSLLLTGLTRDGNFFIENGRIVAPARNLRFNESAIELLTNVAAVGPSERTCVGVAGSSIIIGTAAPREGVHLLVKVKRHLSD